MENIENEVIDGAGMILEPQELVVDTHGITRDKGGKFVGGHGSANPGGRPHGPNFATILGRLLKEKTLSDIDEDELTLKEKMCIDWIKKFMEEGNLKALEMLVNRLDGAPTTTNKVDITSVKSPFDAFRDDQNERNS